MTCHVSFGQKFLVNLSDNCMSNAAWCGSKTFASVSTMGKEDLIAPVDFFFFFLVNSNHPLSKFKIDMSFTSGVPRVISQLNIFNHFACVTFCLLLSLTCLRLAHQHLLYVFTASRFDHISLPFSTFIHPISIICLMSTNKIM